MEAGQQPGCGFIEATSVSAEVPVCLVCVRASGNPLHDFCFEGLNSKNNSQNSLCVFLNIILRIKAVKVTPQANSQQPIESCRPPDPCQAKQEVCSF